MISDPLPWQCLSRYPSSCKNVLFVDIDYKELILKKRDMINQTSALNATFTNVETSEGDILLSSDQYVQIGCDLRDLVSLERAISSAFDVQQCQILLVAEVSITYSKQPLGALLFLEVSEAPRHLMLPLL